MSTSNGLLLEILSGGSRVRMLSVFGRLNFDTGLSASYDAGTGRINITASGGSGSGDVTHTGTLTAGKAVIGNGSADVKASKVTITDPATAATLTIQDGFTLTVSGNANVSGTNTGDQTITLTGDVTGSGTGSFATAIGNAKVTNAMLAGSIAYSKLNLTGAILNADLAGSIDLTSKVTGALPAANGGFGSDVSAASGVPLFATGTPTFTSTTGSGNFVRATSATLVTPALGVATATSVNGLTINTTTGTLVIANLKTLTASNTLTIAGTDGSTLNVGSGGTLGTAAFTNSTAYEVPLTFSTGLTRSANTITIDSTVATLTGSQTLTNKTLTTPTIGSFANANHDHTNSAGGGTLVEAALALTDITTANATSLRHGFLPKLSGSSSDVLKGDGTWGASGGGTTINSTNNVIPYRSNSTTFADSPLTVSGNDVSAAGNIVVGHTKGLSTAGGNQLKIIEGNGSGTGSIAIYSSNVNIGPGVGLLRTTDNGSNTGNVKINGSANRGTTEGNGHLDIFDGTAPAGTLANGISLYSASGELRVLDASGNSTLLSPHDHVTNEWIFYSVNTVTGKVLRIDMERLMRAVDAMLGGGFVHEYIQ
jgi:hypothetical protein